MIYPLSLAPFVCHHSPALDIRLATFRSMAWDEVKVASTHWLTGVVRYVDRNGFHEVPLGITELSEARDGPALVQAIDKIMENVGIPSDQWQLPTTLATVVDGAKVLLHSVCSSLQTKMPD